MEVIRNEIGKYIEVEVDDITVGNIIVNDKNEIEYANIYQEHLCDIQDLKMLKIFVNMIDEYKWVR